eukprot:14442783-Heterocapsa_arctica.AAC.1
MIRRVTRADSGQKARAEAGEERKAVRAKEATGTRVPAGSKRNSPTHDDAEMTGKKLEESRRTRKGRKVTTWTSTAQMTQEDA